MNLLANKPTKFSTKLCALILTFRAEVGKRVFFADRRRNILGDPDFVKCRLGV